MRAVAGLWVVLVGSCVAACNALDDPADSSRDLSILCGNGELVNGQGCNGRIECSDGSDEAQCNGSESFICSSGQLVDGINISCNGINECADGSDEGGCAALDPPPELPVAGSSAVIDPGTFVCDDGTVIPSLLICNGIANCSDGSDEAAGCQPDRPDMLAIDQCLMSVQTSSIRNPMLVTDECVACTCAADIKATLGCGPDCWGLITCVLTRCPIDTGTQCIIDQCSDLISAATTTMALASVMQHACAGPCARAIRQAAER